MATSALSLSAAALISLAAYEGYRSDAYNDGVGVQTIGFGTTTNADGSKVKPGDKIDPVRALVRLNADADKTQREMRACLGDVPLSQNEWDAYVSLAYNIGTSAWCRSGIVRKLKAQPPNYAGACADILKWVNAGGRPLPGLVKRRQREYRMCVGRAD